MNQIKKCQVFYLPLSLQMSVQALISRCAVEKLPCEMDVGRDAPV